MDKGYIQIYTGDGKGKTTAAIGLAIRAYGAGLKIFFAQFVKGQEYSEIKALKKFEDRIFIRQYGRECFIYKKPTEEDIEIARNGWEQVKRAIFEEEYDVIILDELNIALYYELISVKDVIDVLKNKPVSKEVVITGRKMPNEFFEYADLITEMKEIKHYYQKGIQARKGIEF